jgi:hypothetical protein
MDQRVKRGLPGEGPGREAMHKSYHTSVLGTGNFIMHETFWQLHKTSPNGFSYRIGQFFPLLIADLI